MRVVFDTNIYASAFVLPGSHADSAILKIIDGADQLLISKPILNGLLGVLARKFARDADELSRIALFLSDVAEPVRPRRRLEVLKDDADNRVLECAVAGKADAIPTLRGGLRDDWSRRPSPFSRSRMAGQKMVTGHIGRIRQRLPQVEVVLGAGLTGINILMQQQLGSQKFASVLGKHLDGNGRILIDHLIEIHAVNPVAWPGIKTVESGSFQLVCRVATGHRGTGS